MSVIKSCFIKFSIVSALMMQAAGLCSCARADIPPAFEENTEKLTGVSMVTPVESLPEAEVHDFTRYQKQRNAYVDALKAYANGNYDEVRRALREDLRGYPLSINIEYLLLRLPETSLNDIMSFIDNPEHEVLAVRLRDYYISKFDEQLKYQNILKLSREMPENEDSKCLWLKAKYKAGQKADAVAYIRAPFIRAERLSKSCMNLSQALLSAGDLSADNVFTRVYESYWTRNKKAVYLSSSAMLKGNAKYGESIKLLAKYYERPSSYNAIPEKMTATATAVFRRYGRIQPREAMSEMQGFIAKYHPTPQQVRDIKQAIVFSLLFEKNDVPKDYIDSNLPTVGTEAMYKQRVRMAVWDKDYAAIEKYLKYLPEEMQQEDNYMYWRAIALDKLGKKGEAEAIWRKLASERSFYGYMAAEKLNMPYAVNEIAVPAVNQNQRAGFMVKYPAYQRFAEYEFLGDKKGIRTEWKELMGQATVQDARYIAKAEAERGYIDLALWESIYKKDWDVLSLRFPVTYRDIYRNQSNNHKVPLTFMYGITRQESMMNPMAQSPVGARGLMQLMPDTARIVSKKHGVKYTGPGDLFRPEINVNLGTAYLRDMLDDFDGNRIFTSAGYNAGPRRAVKWQSSDGVCRDLATYVEAIPFDETRNYVQKVVLYDYMYQHLLGVNKPQFLSEKERNKCY